MDYDRYGDGTERMEFGYVFFNLIIKIFGDYTIFLLLTNAFIVSSWAVLAKKLFPEWPIITFAFIVVCNLVFPVRLQLATCVCQWSLYFLYEKKYILYTITCITATLIHKSSIMVAPLFLLLPIRIKTPVAYGILFVTLIADIFNEQIVGAILFLASLFDSIYPDLANNLTTYSDCELSGATEMTFTQKIISFGFSLFLLCMLIDARNYTETKHGDLGVCHDKRKINIFINCFIAFTFCYKFFSNEYLANFRRVSEFFTIGYAMAVIFALHTERKTYRLITVYILFILLFLYKLKGLLDTPYPELFYPYKSIL